MKLRARWNGPAPRVGDYLMSPTRPRFAYRVLGVTVAGSRVTWDPVRRGEARRLTIDVERVAILAMPSNARVHDWRWDRRGASSSSSKEARSRLPPGRRARTPQSRAPHA